MIAAAVIPKDKALDVRKQLRIIANSSSWYTTESARSERGRQQIVQLASYLARNCQPVIVVFDQIPESDRNAEATRELAKVAQVIHLGQVEQKSTQSH